MDNDSNVRLRATAFRITRLWSGGPLALPQSLSEANLPAYEPHRRQPKESARIPPSPPVTCWAAPAGSLSDTRHCAHGSRGSAAPTSLAAQRMASAVGTPQGRPWLRMSAAKPQLGSPVQVPGAASAQWSAERVAGFEADIGAGVRRAPRRAPHAALAQTCLVYSPREFRAHSSRFVLWTCIGSLNIEIATFVTML